MAGKCLLASSEDSVNRIWAILSEYGQYERHFNTIQSTYRALASTWMLSAFGGIGYVLSRSTTTINPWALVFSIAIGAGSGLLLLCILDLWVYHRLLLAVFDEAGLLEKEGGLPLLRKRMGKQSRISVNKAVYFFYAIPSLVFAVVAYVSLNQDWHASWDYRFYGRILAAALVGFAFLLLVFLPSHQKERDCEKPDKCPLFSTTP